MMIVLINNTGNVTGCCLLFRFIITLSRNTPEARNYKIMLFACCCVTEEVNKFEF